MALHLNRYVREKQEEDGIKCKRRQGPDCKPCLYSCLFGRGDQLIFTLSPALMMYLASSV